MSEHTERVYDSHSIEKKIEKYVSNSELPDYGYFCDKYYNLETRLKMMEAIVSQQEKTILSQNNKLSLFEEELNNLQHILSGKSFMRSLSSETTQPGCFQ